MMHVKYFSTACLLGFNPFPIQVTNSNSIDWNGTASRDCISIAVGTSGDLVWRQE